ncbi:uncharacterized protein SCHCODRAFT_02618281 [Schizophyllum commune H4-8]|uniref:uncharacterized protein n=1 Tax=Schizophyllum commune (strain H4-8 / FGSC 9210) TaxID=578458 RepID=UPI00215F8573|nr:uncharacterized protein SCHCODRAFT_02618281 [Schizophyllum commune H4-8]KAI5894987.1 hypothetical protein SCHCODRAFT_02618281 [Schizophyllum commune H4-8]
MTRASGIGILCVRRVTRLRACVMVCQVHLRWPTGDPFSMRYVMQKVIVGYVAIVLSCFSYKTSAAHMKIR